MQINRRISRGEQVVYARNAHTKSHRNDRIDTEAISDFSVVSGVSAEPLVINDAQPVRSWRAWVRIGLILADVAAVAVASLAAYLARGSASVITMVGVPVPPALLAAFAIPLWLICHAVYGSYRSDFFNEGFREYRAAVTVGLRAAAVAAVASFAFKLSLSREVVIVFFPVLIVASLAGRYVVRKLLAAARRAGRAKVRLMLVGDVESARRFASHLHRNKSLGYDIVGVCLPKDSGPFSFRERLIPVLGTPDNAVEVARRADVEAVAVANLNLLEEVTLQQLAWSFERSGIDLLVAPDVADVAGPRIRIAPITGLPILHITEPRIDGVLRKLVSLGNQIVAIPMLLMLAPLMLLVALAVKIDSRGPVFYAQERIGYRRKSFRILKFRTMVPDADRRLQEIIHLNEHDGALFKMRNDPRVTRVGRWLRKYSLDELPQLINVARGDMVFVGPRPVLEREAVDFGEAEQRRFLTKPGMTGLWQVTGRSAVPWEEAVKLDLYYVENWSPFLDLSIILRTVRVVIAGTGL